MTSTGRSPLCAPELGRYRLVAELARGGMGNVYLAIAQGPGGFNKLLVVKELKPEFAEDETYVAMFLEEARLAARLTHPNIVQTNEVGSDGPRHYMIMEYLDGRSLYRVVRHLGREGGLPVGAHLRVISEALLGLHYAHELCGFDGESLNIVHRDVSPLNVVVTFDGQSKVLDFGIAKAADSSLETQAGVLKGRVAYMAPEQACGDKVDRRADVFAAGVMIWEAAAARRMWPQMSDVEILSQMLREGPPRLRSVCPDAPPDLDAICARALALEPDGRYANAAALFEDLETHLAKRDDALSMRQIGALVSRSFAAERKRMNAVIDESLVRARGGSRSGVMPTFQVRTPGTLSVSHTRGIVDEASSIPSLIPSTPSSQSSLLRGATGGSGRDVLQPALQITPSGPSRGTRLVGPLSALLVAAVAVGVVVGRPIRSNLPTGHPAPTNPVAPTRIQPETIEFSARASPAGAQISIDGKAAPSNPFQARLTKDGEIHHVAAFAEGYESKTADVAFGGDVAVEFGLERRAPAGPHLAQPVRVTPAGPVTQAPRGARPGGFEPRSAPVPVDVAAAPPSPPPRGDVEPTGGRPPLHPIVTSNPYGAP